MSSNLNYKQVANITRRTWDVEAYEKRAQERAKNETRGIRGGGGGGATGAGAASAAGTDNDDDAKRKEEFTPAAPGAAGPHLSKRAFLKARTHKVDGLDSKIGSVEMINPEAVATTKSITSTPTTNDSSSTSTSTTPLTNAQAVTKSGVGWHCKVCDCFLRDSHTYLDHINGRKHQRNLGYSMRVERSTKDQVASRLAALADEQKANKQKDDPTTRMLWDVTKKDKPTKGLDEEDGDGEEGIDDLYHAMVKAKDEELRLKKEARKRERKEHKKNKKKLLQQGRHQQQRNDEEVEVSQSPAAAVAGDDDDHGDANDGDDQEDGGGIDPSLSAMMGFSGFGGGNKNR